MHFDFSVSHNTVSTTDCIHYTNVHKQEIMAFSWSLSLFEISEGKCFSEIGEKHIFMRGMVPIFGPKNGQTSALVDQGEII